MASLQTPEVRLGLTLWRSKRKLHRAERLPGSFTVSTQTRGRDTPGMSDWSLKLSVSTGQDTYLQALVTVAILGLTGVAQHGDKEPFGIRTQINVRCCL